MDMFVVVSLFVGLGYRSGMWVDGRLDVVVGIGSLGGGGASDLLDTFMLPSLVSTTLTNARARTTVPSHLPRKFWSEFHDRPR